VKLHPYEYVEADSVAHAVSLLHEHGHDATLLAGGTVVVPLMKHDLLRPGVLVSVQHIVGLRSIDLDTEAVSIGCSVTHREAAASKPLSEHIPLLRYACSRVASPTIRNMGTLGGNLCYAESASDPSPALLVLGAKVHATGPEGPRVIPIEEFFVGFYQTALHSAEMVTTIEVPHQPASAHWSYLKWTPRAGEDKPLLGLAVLLERREGTWETKIAVGGIAERPVLLEQAMTAVGAGGVEDAVLEAAGEEAASEVDPIDDLQGSPEYRREMLAVWVTRALKALRDRFGGLDG
jgi:carbon-monoxide dehydrogenase medium subunit